MDLFDHLPISALINNKFLCIHGGISNDIKSLEDIEKIDRVKEVPKSGLFCDLMWADPVDNDTGKLEGKVKVNEARGCSYYFGYELAKGFLSKNGLLSIIRAH